MVDEEDEEEDGGAAVRSTTPFDAAAATAAAAGLLLILLFVFTVELGSFLHTGGELAATPEGAVERERTTNHRDKQRVHQEALSVG